ncbi:hypothetical protein TBLA_0H01000 [Henningerozyma blattae CBS 6284]|uniref:Succinate dehydrogenase [ubiquinone] cytochrome b small subunit n=1 Tax=Henningerozyma blattae (strain ATCC 34711 / CBS 6284 / DSM 70876 / NBRC 10599 / NRRL Y-10934 / UCD 77-7) TaxID=1071380 RepID=I2H7N6_HENB6|nr:hypothetical protein TBLA_0H01000 [Tetrapisispora blattae CBS 6284]CCH62388.1 hypothetical protein TBLA_0H01000 [Tetrapisispora blattae CBS 6284]
MSYLLPRTLCKQSVARSALSSTLLKTHTPLLSTSSLIKISSFHTTSPANFKIPLLPMQPQVPGGVIGDVNEAFIPQPVNKSTGSHHWFFERAVEISVLPLVTASLVTGGELGAVTDGLMAAAVLVHCGLELESSIEDYIPRRLYGNWHNYCIWMLYAGSLVSFYGIYQFEKNDVGFSKTIKALFTNNDSELIKKDAKE